jgi:hypothetical protein
MKKREKIKKLRLHRETLRDLDEADSQRVAGGGWLTFSCPSGVCCFFTDHTICDC